MKKKSVKNLSKVMSSIKAQHRGKQKSAKKKHIFVGGGVVVYLFRRGAGSIKGISRAEKGADED